MKKLGKFQCWAKQLLYKQKRVIFKEAVEAEKNRYLFVILFLMPVTLFVNNINTKSEVIVIVIQKMKGTQLGDMPSLLRNQPRLH